MILSFQGFGKLVQMVHQLIKVFKNSTVYDGAVRKINKIYVRSLFIFLNPGGEIIKNKDNFGLDNALSVA